MLRQRRTGGRCAGRRGAGTAGGAAGGMERVGSASPEAGRRRGGARSRVLGGACSRVAGLPAPPEEEAPAGRGAVAGGDGPVGGRAFGAGGKAMVTTAALDGVDGRGRRRRRWQRGREARARWGFSPGAPLPNALGHGVLGTARPPDAGVPPANGPKRVHGRSMRARRPRTQDVRRQPPRPAATARSAGHRSCASPARPALRSTRIVPLGTRASRPHRSVAASPSHLRARTPASEGRAVPRTPCPHMQLRPSPSPERSGASRRPPASTGAQATATRGGNEPERRPKARRASQRGRPTAGSAAVPA